MELFFDIVISSVGLAYFIFGKKNADSLYLIFGLILMFYSYFVPGFLFNVIMGLVLAICPFALRNLP